jgi:Zn-dependent protease
MGGSLKIGRLFSIDVKVHWTFFLLVAFFAFLGYQGASNVAGALLTTALIVMLFLSVLSHEYSHSLVAQQLGIEIRDITLLPIGGVSNMRASPETPSMILARRASSRGSS